MARKRVTTQAQYDKKIEKQQERVDKAKAKLDDIQPKYDDAKKAYEKELADLEDLEAAKARSFNEIMIDYMKNHKHKNSDETYYESFQKTIEEQYGTDFFSSTVVDMAQEKKNRRRAGIAEKKEADAEE
ncbi:Uncharacterised protein [Slackia heliotrinireducens]|uniref:Uncharacterized protein n=1 Tax=Slackia heliotrinireducens (strain ATCC 29202 / DSM 20476 / NCTC 11029 / RHS 1) TaxID=471855 RepID=C7N7Z5_SLAHD|nr:hypothetical protein [Slackia heliotrinireducens]ACV23030.1 hypothetical protein Shel_20160 [Slackia heliotrinireducens DSM 20476]VEH01949.1 Uncharacterised protein [Slackia heliotrinireducens]